MREIETTIVIERRVESVFDYVVNPESWPVWSTAGTSSATRPVSRR